MNEKPIADHDSGAKREWTPLELAEMKTGRRLGPIHQAPGFSSRRRIKFEGGTGCYHVMSRIVGGEFLLGDLEKEAFRRMMWRMAEFAGVELLTYALMDNHFHLLVKVPDRERWLKRFEGEEGESRLLAHLGKVYSKAFLKQLEGELAKLRDQGREKEIEVLLDRFKRRFCDVSLFVKELKERFSRWYNKLHGRRGTLWMDRFHSVLVENGDALRMMAAYIDLNPVRAGLVDDPAKCRWTGYGEAVSGSRRARRGLCKIVEAPQDAWETKASSIYRCWLYEEGVSVAEKDPKTGEKREPKKKGMSVEEMTKVKLKEGLKLRENRIRAMSRGVVLGSEGFVREVSERYREEMGRTRMKLGKKLLSGRGRVFVMRE